MWGERWKDPCGIKVEAALEAAGSLQLRSKCQLQTWLRQSVLTSSVPFAMVECHFMDIRARCQYGIVEINVIRRAGAQWLCFLFLWIAAGCILGK